MKNYLPSKNFTYLIIACAILALGLVLVSKFFFGSNKTTALNKQNEQLESADFAIEDLLQKDSDGDGIPDWEEALWGTDKDKKATFDGVPDGEYVKNRKEELKLAEGAGTADGSQSSADESNLNETDKFARQFFATFIALKQSGQVDADTINGLSGSLGQQIINPDLPLRYTQADIKLGAGGKENDKKYYLAVQDLFKNYQDTRIGEEIDILAEVAGNDYATEDQKIEAIAALNDITDSYQDFAKKLSRIPVPSELVIFHLAIANNANNTGISVTNLAKAIDDPILGLSGLSQYEKYSEALISSADDLKKYLFNNGILIE